MVSRGGAEIKQIEHQHAELKKFPFFALLRLYDLF